VKTKKIRYFINQENHGNEHLLVHGYAVDFASVRFCVRERSPGSWVCDHYDTGRYFGWIAVSKKDAIRHGIDILNRNLASGKYAEVINAYNRGEL
jgi:hypothetical protein